MIIIINAYFLDVSRRFARNNSLLGSTGRVGKGEDTFIVVGFNNWKKAVSVFSDHERSKQHIASINAFETFRSTKTVVTLLNKKLSSDQEIHRKILLQQFVLLRFFCRQGL